MFKLLASSAVVDVKVFYTWSQSRTKVYDPDFNLERNWDIDLLKGYPYKFVNNVAKNPGSHHYKGIVNPTLITEIKKWGAEALLVFGWNFSSHLQAMRYFKGTIPVLFRGDSTLIDETEGFSMKKVIRRFVLSWVYRHIDYALYVGTANRNYFLAHGVKQEQLIFAPHAIDNERFVKDDSKQNERARKWRNQLGIELEDIVFLFAGKLTPKKNPELLIRAFQAVRDQAKAKMKLVIAGTGELEGVLKENFEKDNDIRFIGFQNQSQMPELYRVGDIYVMPSRGPGETWGLAVNEAMACRRAVLVSSACGCAVDLIETSINGYVFKNDQLNDLVDKMSLLSDKEAAAKIGERASDKIMDWNYEKIIKAVELFIEKTLLN